jgi:putative salt-induced outer membrane protein
VTTLKNTLAGLALGALALVLPAPPALADCPCPAGSTESPAWTGNIAAGLAITSGNTDTKTFNIGAAASSDAKKRNVLKLDGLYLKSSTSGDETVSRAALGVRDEYGLGKRSFVFAEVRYLHDQFKDIKYLVSPLVGFGYKLVDEKTVGLSIDTAIGGAFEEPESGDSTNSGAFHFGEAFGWKLTPTATFSESATGLWKTNDTTDALYRFEASLSASVSSKFELKISFADEYKNKPTSAAIKKNDTALLANVVYKF